MKNKKVLKIIIASLFIIISSVVAASANKNIKADVASFGLFESYDTTISYGVNYKEKEAISFVPDNKGSSFNFTNSFIQKSSIEFDLNNEKFSGTILFKYESNNDSFDVALEYSNGDINAYVVKNNNKAGVYGSVGNTTVHNASNEYTQIKPEANIVLSFDSLSKEVYISSGSGSLLIWDFSNEENDGKAFYLLDDFIEYRISVVFETYMDKKPELLLYKINDTFVGNGLIERRRKPSISALQSYDSVCGSTYYLPKPTAYDLIDGPINDINVTIKNDNGKIVLNKKYIDDLSFVTDTSRYYEVEYSVSNSYGINNTYNFELINYESIESTNTNVIVDSNSIDEIVGLNSRLKVSKAHFSSDLLLVSTKLPVYFTLYKNGVAIENYIKKDASIDSFFDVKEEGNYSVKYFIDNPYIQSEKEFNFNVINNKEVLVSDELDEYYCFNETLNIGRGTIYYNNEHVKADTKIIFPSGACYLNKQITLSEKGTYKIEYSGTINGNLYSFNKYFTVVDSIQSLFTSSDNTILELGSSNVTSKVKGVHVTTKNNDILKYNKIVDLRTLSKNDLLVEMMADVSVYGQYDYTDINVYLTDIYDETNYITINCMFSKGNSNNNGTYIKTAASNGQTLVGWYGGSESNKVIQTIWGYDTRHSFVGNSDHGEISNNTLKLYFDYDNLRLYSGPAWGSGVDEIQKGLVSDYDSTDFYGVTWNGFTTGEVYISIQVKGAVRRNVGYTISSIGGLELNSQYYISQKQPYLDINRNGEVVIPFGLVNKEYKLFDAKALDGETNQELEYTRNIYYKYGTAYEAEIPYEGNSFIPQMPGSYRVIYKVVDKYGYSSIDSYTIDVYQDYESIDFDFSSMNDRYFVGSFVDLPTISNVSNSSGNYHISYYIELNGEKKEITSPSFKIENTGLYKLIINVKDYIGREKTKEVSFYSVISSNPILNNEIVLPHYFLTEHTYVLPVVEAIDYTTNINGVPVVPKIYVSDANSTNYLLEDYTYNPANSGDLTSYISSIKYVYETENGRSEYTYNIETIKSKTKNEYYLSNYFKIENANKVLSDQFVQFKLEKDKIAYISFINSISSRTFSLDFAIIGEIVGEFDSIKIKLTDSIDSSICLIFEINFIGDNTYITVNGETTALFSYSLFGDDMRQYNIKYKDGSFYDILMKTLFTPKKDINGNDFAGFTSNKLYLDIEIDSNTEQEFDILSINNQAFSSNLKYDKTTPELVLDSFGGVYEIGSIVTITGGDAYDVLSDVSYFNVTVKHNGAFVTSLDGIKLNNVDAKNIYSFVVDEYGTYQVTYSSKDTCTAKGNSEVSVTKMILVIDEVPPTISISGGYNSSYKINSTINIIAHSVSDNKTENPKSFVCIINPNGKIEFVDTTYTFSAYGTYRIRYFAYDDEGNISYIDFVVDVTD